jgi:hypothetical protein
LARKDNRSHLEQAPGDKKPGTVPAQWQETGGSLRAMA